MKKAKSASAVIDKHLKSCSKCRGRVIIALLQLDASGSGLYPTPALELANREFAEEAATSTQTPPSRCVSVEKNKHRSRNSFNLCALREGFCRVLVPPGIH